MKFYNFHIIGPNATKESLLYSSLQGPFQWYQEGDQGTYSFGDFTIINKQHNLR